MRRKGRPPSLDDVVDEVLDAITTNAVQIHEEAQQMAVHHARIAQISADTMALVERLREGLGGD